MLQVQVPLCGLPVNLVLLQNGTLVFIKVAKVGIIIDQPETGLNAEFDDHGFSIAGEDFWYNTIYEYKQIPNMLKWLQQQNMIEPVVQFVRTEG